MAARELAPARSAVEEVAGPLDRGGIGSSGGQIRQALGPLLVVDAGQGMATRHLIGSDRHDQAAVGERRVVPALAHPVGAEVSPAR